MDGFYRCSASHPRPSQQDTWIHVILIGIFPPAEACVSPFRVPVGVSLDVNVIHWFALETVPHLFFFSVPLHAKRKRRPPLVRLRCYSSMQFHFHLLTSPLEAGLLAYGVGGGVPPTARSQQGMIGSRTERTIK